MQAITEKHGYKVLVRTGPGRYHWGTCVNEEYVNPLTNRRKIISATWSHCRGEVTHRSFATQTNSENSDEFTFQITAYNNSCCIKFIINTHNYLN